MIGGHGHVVPRPDGGRARCGGPRMCAVCRAEEASLKPKRFITLYGVRSVEDPTKWRSYGESFSRGKPFEDAQFWRNPKTAAKEAREQERQRAWADDLVARGVHKATSYMGQCEVVPIRIEEPA